MARRKRESRRRRKDWFGKGTKSRKVLVGLCIAFVSLILFTILGYYQLLNWLQGEGFRGVLGENLRNKAQAESVEIPQNLSIQGSRLSLPLMHMERKGLLSEVTAKRISSEVERGALLDRQLKLDKLTVEELSISMDAARAGEELPPVEERENHFWNRFTPATTAIGAFECKNTDVALLFRGERYALSGISVSAQPNGKGDDSPWRIDFENGRIRTPLYYLQDCSVKTATMLVGSKDGADIFDLGNCRIQLTPGELNLKGSFNDESKLWSASLSASKANVARVLKGDWKKKITGELFGTLKITGKGARISEANGSIRLLQGVLEGLPIISEIELGETRPFRTIRLSKAECRVSYPYNEPTYNISGAWLFDSIDLRSEDDLLRVTGHVIVGAGEELGGTLCIGISKSLLQEYGLGDNAVLAELFTGKGDDNYHWVNLNLSGTLDSPQEDLSVRISTIMRQALPGIAGNAIKKTAGALINLISGKKSDANDEAAPGDQGKKEADDTNEEDEEEEDIPDGEDDRPSPAGKMINGAAEGTGKLIKGGLDILF